MTESNTPDSRIIQVLHGMPPSAHFRLASILMARAVMPDWADELMGLTPEHLGKLADAIIELVGPTVETGNIEGVAP